MIYLLKNNLLPRYTTGSAPTHEGEGRQRAREHRSARHSTRRFVQRRRLAPRYRRSEFQVNFEIVMLNFTVNSGVNFR